MRIFNFKNLILVFLLLLNLLLFVKLDFFLPQILGITQLPDFDAYIRLVNTLLAGGNPYQVNYMQTLGPPSVFIYYLPFSQMDINTARTISTVINFLCGLFSNYLLAKNLFQKERKAVFLLLNLLLFSSFPARFSIEMGQPNLVLMFLITFIITQKKEKLKTTAIALLIAMKTFFIFIPFSYLKAHKNIAYKIVGLLALIIIIFMPFIIFNSYYFYLNNKLLDIIRTSNAISGLDYYNQSYGSTLARLGIIVQSKSYYSILVPLVAYIVYRFKSFSSAVILGLILSFVSWQHYYVILFPIFVRAYKNSPRVLIPILLILFFFCWVEFPWLHNALKTDFTGILASHYFLSAFGLGIYLYLIRFLKSRNLIDLPNN